MRSIVPLPSEESLTVEFKSDLKKLPDRELIETVVCLANTEGGTIYLVVEDNGRPTGLHPDHRQLEGLPAMVANRTAPPVPVQAEPLETGGHVVACIQVPKARNIVATTDGTMKRAGLVRTGDPNAFLSCRMKSQRALPT